MIFREIQCTFLVFRKTPVIIPARNQYHIISQIFPLDLCLLENDYIGLEDIKHGIEGSFVSPWLISKWVSYAIDVPGGDSDAHCCSEPPPPHRRGNEDEQTPREDRRELLGEIEPVNWNGDKQWLTIRGSVERRIYTRG